MKICIKCGNTISDRRKKYCSDSCKWWFNAIRKDNEKHLPPFRKRNRNYFNMVIGYKKANDRGQGRRSGGMIKGAMSAMVFVTVEELAEVNADNLRRHFKGVPGYIPNGIALGDGTWVKPQEIYKELGIILLP